MLERLLLTAVIAATSATAVACEISEAAPLMPAPSRNDGGGADAGPSADARIVDGGLDARAVDAGIDAGAPDAGVRRRRSPRDAGVLDAGVLDAAAPDAGGSDAMPADAAMSDAPPSVDAPPPVDGRHRDILRDSGEAPGLYDARIL